MPPARKRAPRATQDTAPNTEANATESDEEEGEEAPKAPKAPKVYAVKDAELANSLVGEDFDEINEGDEVTGEMLDSMRSNKAKWDSPEDGGIKHVFGMNSAIPLRNILNKWLASSDEEGALDIEDVDSLYEAMIAGDGWITLAARCGDGVTATDVRAALKDKVEAEHEVDITEGGRAYGKGENWTWVTADQLNEAKAANGNGDDAEEGDDEEGDEESTDASDTAEEDTGDEEAPAPRRRRRAPAA